LLGSPVPLESGRGYNVTLNNPGIEFEHLVVSRGNIKFTLSSLSVGLRVGGALEFAGVDSAPDYRRARAALESVKRSFPDINTDDYAMWCGDRPMTPDTLPVISRSPRHAGLYYAFGHGHLGLTMAAVSGRLIAELVAGRTTSIDLEPYRIDRY
jgi:D-amino-acid dehydrogenase